MSATQRHYETIRGIIATSVAIPARKYSAYTTRDDLVQDAWLWCLEHDGKVSQYLDTDDDVKVHKRGCELLGFRLKHLAERSGRRAKAASCGYSVRDEYFYSRKTVADLLAVWLAGETEWSAQTPVSDGDQPARRARKDPAEGGDIHAYLADVSGAYSRLVKAEQDLLWRVLGPDGETVGDIAQESGVTTRTLDRWIDRSLDPIIELVGGVSPWR